MLGYKKSVIYLHIKAPNYGGFFFVAFCWVFFFIFALIIFSFIFILLCFIFKYNFTIQPTVLFPGVR